MKTAITFDSLSHHTVEIENYCSSDVNEIKIAICSEKDEIYVGVIITTEEAEQLIATIESVIELTRKNNNKYEK